MRPMVAIIVAAVVASTPGMVSRRRMSSEASTCPAISASMTASSWLRKSIWRRQPLSVWRSSMGSSSVAIHWRPALPNRSLTSGGAMRLRTRTAETSFLVRVRWRMSWVRREVSRRSARVGSSAIHTCGSRSAASNSARVRASTRSFLTLAWLIARTCIGLASTTLVTWRRRMPAMASALPVDSNTTWSSAARLDANSSSASRVVSMRPTERARPRSQIATSQKSRCTSRPRYRLRLPSCDWAWEIRGAERQLRIRARSTPGVVAGAASYVNGLAAQEANAACPLCVLPPKPQRPGRRRYAPPGTPRATATRSFIPVCQEIDLSCLGVGRLEEVPEAAGEVAFEAADGFFGVLALGAFAGDVGLGLGVAAQAGDGDAVDGGVDLAVAAAVEAVAVGLAGADRDRGDARGAGELGVGGEPVGAGDLADELGGGQRPEARLGKQLWRDVGDELGDLGLERLERGGELADAAQLVAGDTNARRLFGAREPPGDARAPGAVKQRAAR